MNIYLKILNYTIRIIIIILGIMLTAGWLAPQEGDGTMFRVMGIIFILFGIYRVVTFHTQSKRYKRDED